MGIDRRILLVGALVGTLGFVLLDPIGLSDAVRGWLAVAGPADGPVPEVASAARSRRVRVERLGAVLERDPALSGALFVAGLGAGVLLGGVCGYLHQRALLRRGERDV